MAIAPSKNGLYIKIKFQVSGNTYQFTPIKKGLWENPADRSEAERISRWIEKDLEFGEFDPTLTKYKPHKFQASQPKSQTLKDVWDAYVTYKQKAWRPGTQQYMKGLGKFIYKCPYQDLDALKVREWLLNQSGTTESMAKRTLTHLNAAIKFGIKHGLIQLGASPFDGLASDLKHNYEIESIPMVLSVDDKNRVLEAFKNHQGNWNGRGYAGYKYDFYYPYVSTLFLTGRRPEEVVQWEWQMIKKTHIAIPGAITKTGRDGKFPIYPDLLEVLEGMPRDGGDLIFKSVTGKPLHYGRFSQTVWDKVVNPLFPGQNFTPRCARDTFITEQILLHGRSESLVAKWCDTSPSEIRRRYLGDAEIYDLQPGSPN